MKLSEINGIYPDGRSNRESDKLYDNSVFCGVEFEIEGFHRYDHSPFSDEFWSVTQDGSLRNDGVEFVTNYVGKVGNGHKVHKNHQKAMPIRGADLVDALERLEAYIEKYEATWNEVDVSSRTSTHVHVDVRDLDVQQLIMYVFLYIMFEQVFYNMVGKGREYNVHCKPFFNNDETKELLANIVLCGESKVNIHGYMIKLPKYDGVNINAALNYGTLEFRIHQGSKQPTEIIPWINILLRMREAAMTEQVDLAGFPEHVSGEGFLQFVEKVFGPLTPTVAPFVEQSIVAAGVRQVQEILRMRQIQIVNRRYLSQGGGKKAGENSIIHEWARAHNREVIELGD